jgi:hypothetical protein
LLCIYALEDGVEQTLLFDDTRDGQVGAKVVDLDPITDVEGVFEEDEDAADHELVNGSTGSEGEAYDENGSGLLELLNGINVCGGWY